MNVLLNITLIIYTKFQFIINMIGFIFNNDFILIEIYLLKIHLIINIIYFQIFLFFIFL